MKVKAHSAITRYHMLNTGDHVVVGVSGGADSMALLHLLYTLRTELALTLTVCHVNHGIRGQEAERDEQAVLEYCKLLKVPCEVVRADVPALAAQRRVSIEACGRMVRYEAFKRLAAPDNAKIATAHTLSDSLETMLFHLARGTGLKGLCGIPPVRENIIRPLIEATRTEVEDYCSRNQVPYLTDSTNLLPDYTRNRIRMEVVPALMSVHAAGADAVRNTLRILREDERYLSQQAAAALEQSIVRDGYDTRKLAALPLPLRTRAVAQILARSRVTVRMGFIEQLSELLCEDKAALSLGRNMIARVEQGLLRIQWQDTVAAPDYCVPLMEGDVALFENIKAKVEFVQDFHEDCLKKIHPKLLKNMFDYDNIIGTAYFRPRREGDSIRLVKRGCTKTLKKLMHEQGIPRALRAFVPVIADEQGVIWVDGFGPAERVIVSAATKRAVIVEISTGV